MELAHDRDDWRALCECCNKLSGSIKCQYFFTSYNTVSFSRRIVLVSVRK